jgi:hypothetical protein
MLNITHNPNQKVWYLILILPAPLANLTEFLAYFPWKEKQSLWDHHSLHPSVWLCALINKLLNQLVDFYDIQWKVIPLYVTLTPYFKKFNILLLDREFLLSLLLLLFIVENMKKFETNSDIHSTCISIRYRYNLHVPNTNLNTKRYLLYWN